MDGSLLWAVLSSLLLPNAHHSPLGHTWALKLTFCFTSLSFKAPRK